MRRVGLHFNNEHNPIAWEWHMKCLNGIICVMFLLLIGTSAAIAAPIRVGVVLDGPWARYQSVPEQFRQEVLDVAQGEFEIEFPEAMQLDGGWTIAGIDAALDQLLADQQVDIVIALGYGASNQAARREVLAKPVIAPLVVDSVARDFPRKGNGSGKKNLSYLTAYQNLEKEILSFQAVADFTNLVILADSVLLDILPEASVVVRNLSNELDLDISLVPVLSGPEQILELLPDAVDAVLVTPLLQFSQAEFEILAKGLVERQLPSYSTWGYNEVEAGLLTGSVPQGGLTVIARTTAIHVLDILRGEAAQSLSISSTVKLEPIINMGVARAIGVYPDWDLLTRARLINDQDQEHGRTLGLQQAVDEALRANLDLLAADQVVAAGEYRIKESRSPLLPQLGIGANYQMIDENSAIASQGLQPERTSNAVASFSQVLYSEKAWTTFSVEKYGQVSREQAREELRLDILLAASTAYLNILRARAIEEIQKDNLKLTRANLEQAQVRVQVGSAGPEEVYRWESSIASNRQSVLKAESETINARQALNRILNRPLREKVTLVEEGEVDPFDMIGDQRLFFVLENDQRLDLYRDFLVQEGMRLSPELRRLDADITAQKRLKSAAKRNFWVPTVALVGDYQYRLNKSGAGSTLPGADNDTVWSAGVFASLPMFTGGGRYATLKRTTTEIDRLKLTRASFAVNIEEQVLIASNLVRASWPGIRLSKDAAEAAEKNLQLVSDSYERGVLSIIDLLDAQNLVLVSNQSAANAIFDFLSDLMTVQRASGQFVFLEEEETQQVWMDQLVLYFEQSGILFPDH